MNSEEIKREQDKKRNDLIWVVSTPQGRRWYWNLMSECKPFSDKFIESVNLTNYMKGVKTVGLNMYHDLLDADPSAFIKMRDENQAQDTRKDLRIEKSIKEKQSNPLKIDSPTLPNTEAEMSVGGMR